MVMVMNLEIDYRERDIIELFKSEKDIVTNVNNLIIGDFIIKKDEDILFIIERKSIKDLCASILDGRYREQKNRLIESIQDSNKIIYIIEGKKEDFYNITKKTINSAILNLIFKHKYNVIFTESKQDTVDNIILLYKKIQNNDLEINVVSKINLVKKSDKINNNVFINMICIIPGVSEKTAIKIQEKYNTLIDLINAYNLINGENDKKKMLSEILINTNRKLGKTLSEKIYNSIFNGVLNIKEKIPIIKIPKTKERIPKIIPKTITKTIPKTIPKTKEEDLKCLL